MIIDVPPFLALLAANQLLYFIFVYAIPMGFCFLLGFGIVHEFILMSKPAKVLRGLKRKRNAVLVGAVKEGILSLKIGKTDAGEGMIQCGNPGDFVFFIPNQIRENQKWNLEYLTDEEGNPLVTQTPDGKTVRVVRRISETDPDVIKFNELIKQRIILEDVNKPVYFGSTGDCLAFAPTLIDAAEESLDEQKEETYKPQYPLRLFSLDTLRSLVNFSLTPEALRRYGEQWRLYGELGKKPSGGFRKVLPWLLLLGIIGAVAVLLIMTGGDLGSMFGSNQLRV